MMTKQLEMWTTAVKRRFWFPHKRDKFWSIIIFHLVLKEFHARTYEGCVL